MAGAPLIDGWGTSVDVFESASGRRGADGIDARA
jgi:hypothetical protein